MTFQQRKIARREFLKMAVLGGGLVAVTIPSLITALSADSVPAADATRLDSDLQVLNVGRGPEVIAAYHTDQGISSFSFEPGLAQAKDSYPGQNSADLDRILQSRQSGPIRNPYSVARFSPLQNDFFRTMARNAWEFIRVYTQPSGLVLPFVVHDSATLEDTSQTMMAGWEMGSMLLAIVAAVRVDVLSSAEAKARLGTLLDTISSLGTYQGYYTSFYDAVSAERFDSAEADDAHSLDAVDVGRLLIGLRAVQQNYPDFDRIVEQIVAKLPLDQLIANGALQSLNYDDHSATAERVHPFSEYASLGFQLFDRPSAYQTSPIEHEQIKIAGYDFYLPANGTVTAVLGPYLYQIFEVAYQNHSLAFPVIEKMLRASQGREQGTHILTAMAEGSSIRRGAKNLYCAVVSRKDGVYRLFPVYHHPSSQLIDTSFTMESLRFAGTGTVLAQLVLNDVFNTSFDWTTRMAYLRSAFVPGHGFYNGRYDSDQKWNLDLDLNNHALMLEAAAFAVTRTPLTQPIENF